MQARVRDIDGLLLVIDEHGEIRVTLWDALRLCQRHQPLAGTTFCCDKLRGNEKEKVEPCPSTLSTHSFPS